MIEECMLKANETVAEYLTEKNLGGIFRVHDEPDSTNFENFFTFLRILGYNLPSKPTSQEIADIFIRAKESPHIEQIAVKYIRSQKLAVYSPDNIGHYGLRLDNYSHFTSPIRRYSDLIVHRILFEGAYEPLELKAAADRCSENERKSFVAETSVVKLKKYRLLDSYFDEDVDREYKGIITNVSPKGVTFDLLELGIDGSISMRALEDDYYIFDEKKMILTGRHKGFVYRLGDPLRLKLEAIDLVFLEAEWSIA
jgi:ribonuclease R